MSNKWVVAYIDFFENDLKMSTTFAETEIEALYNTAAIFDFDTGDFKTTDPEEFKDFCSECDCAIEVYNI